jgi:hypothetical protein
MGPLKPPRISIAGLMLGVAVAAFPFALLGSVLRERPMLGLDGLEMGVLPSVTALGIGLASIILRRGRCGAFAAGFQVAGWAAVMVYVACCRIFPEFMNAPYVYYVNDVEPYIMNADYWEIYALSLVLSGFIWGIPQLLVALAGGGLGILVAPRTIVRGSRSSAGTDSVLDP